MNRLIGQRTGKECQFSGQGNKNCSDSPIPDLPFIGGPKAVINKAFSPRVGQDWRISPVLSFFMQLTTANSGFLLALTG